MKTIIKGAIKTITKGVMKTIVKEVMKTIAQGGNENDNKRGLKINYTENFKD